MFERAKLNKFTLLDTVDIAERDEALAQELQALAEENYVTIVRRGAYIVVSFYLFSSFLIVSGFLGETSLFSSVSLFSSIILLSPIHVVDLQSDSISLCVIYGVLRPKAR